MSVVGVVSDQSEQRWGSSLGAQENHSLRGRIWGVTGGLKWKWQGAAAAAAEGPGEVELAEGVAAAWKGLHWSWRWELS